MWFKKQHKPLVPIPLDQLHTLTFSERDGSQKAHAKFPEERLREIHVPSEAQAQALGEPSEIEARASQERPPARRALPFRRPLNVFAAVLLVSLLVGSFFTVLNLMKQASVHPASPFSDPADRLNWRVVQAPPGPDPTTTYQLSAVAALAENDAWAVGWGTNPSRQQSAGLVPAESLLEHWNGKHWSLVSHPYETASELHGVVALNPNNVWAVGQTMTGNPIIPYVLVEHWDGLHWHVTPLSDISTRPGGLRAVAASSASDIWAVGHIQQHTGDVLDSALVAHWDGHQWHASTLVLPGQQGSDLTAVAALAPNDVWVVGEVVVNGNVLPLIDHWDGSQWHVVPIPDPDQHLLWQVSAISANDLWFVGEDFKDVRQPSVFSQSQALVLHWNGRAFVRFLQPDSSQAKSISGIVARASNDVWMVGSVWGQNPASHQSLVEHWNGQQWKRVTGPGSACNIFLNGITAIPHTHTLWAIGGLAHACTFPYSLTMTFFEAQTS